MGRRCNLQGNIHSCSPWCCECNHTFHAPCRRCLYALPSPEGSVLRGRNTNKTLEQSYRKWNSNIFPAMLNIDVVGVFALRLISNTYFDVESVRLEILIAQSVKFCQVNPQIGRL